MASPKSPERTDATPTGHSGLWLNLVAPDEAEIRRVEAETGIRVPRREELVQIEPSSRFVFKDGLLRVATPIIVRADTDHPTLAHVGFVVTPKLLITVRYEAPDVFLAARDDAGASAPALFASVLRSFIARQADLLEVARGQLDEISHGVFRVRSTSRRRIRRSNAALRERLRELGRLGDRASMIRDSLMAMERMIRFALDATGDWFAAEEKAQLHLVLDDINSLTLFEEHLLEKLQFLLDAVLGFINIEQNDIFKVLTIASVVGIFPTLVVGWYGMNFHMPELGWKFGYPYGIGVVALSTLAPLAWFKWRGWL